MSKASPANSANNNSMKDVLGNRLDASFSNMSAYPSVMGFLKAGYKHVHAPCFVYPGKADPVTVASGAVTPWVDGNKIEIIPAGAITQWFDLHWAQISAISANDDYTMTLWSGASADVQIAQFSFVRNDNFSQEGDRPIQIIPLAPNTKVSASLACGDGDGATCAVKFYYHMYDDIV